MKDIFLQIFLAFVFTVLYNKGKEKIYKKGSLFAAIFLKKENGMDKKEKEACIGSQNVSKGRCIAALDWFEFTLWDFSVPAIIEQLFKLSAEQFQKAQGNYYGYCTKYTLGADARITIWADGGAQQGVHVIITARGCAYFQEAMPLLDLLMALSSLCVQVTRLDLALDDKTENWYTVAQLVDHARNMEIISQWRGCDVSMGYSLASGEKDKAVIYMGSMYSNQFLRVYDKRLEQNARGVQLTVLPERWTRWEFCLRNEKAQAVLHKLQQGRSLNQIFAGLLSESMRIVKADKQQINRSRWKARLKWLRFVPAVAQADGCSA